MIDYVQVCLTIALNIGILALIAVISYKKIVPYLMKKTLAGYMSGFARNQKAVKKQVVKIMMDKTLVGPALDMLGFTELKNYLIRHPDATQTVITMLAPYLEQLIQQVNPEAITKGLTFESPLPMQDFTNPNIKERLKALMEKIHTGENLKNG